MEIRINDKVSAISALIVALSILIAIKFSSYILPDKYYFSISSVFKADDSLMLVAHPGVTGKRFCEIVRKYKVSASDLDINNIDCTKDREDEEYDPKQFELNTNQQNRIYDTWITHRKDIFEKLNSTLDRTTLSKEIFRELMSIEVSQREQMRFSGNLIGSVYRATIRTTKAKLDDSIAPYFETDLEEIRKEFQQGDLDFEDRSEGREFVSDEQFERLRSRIALDVYFRIAARLEENRPIDIDFTELRNAVENAGEHWAVESAISEAYAKAIIGPYSDIIDKRLSEEGLRAENVKQAVALVQTEFIMENLPTYIFSATIRFMLVFLAVFLVAFLNRKNFEIENYAIGAAFAAILLTWPVISLWDWVVREEWQTLKIVFLLLYAAYALAFYLTGRAAAKSAVLTRQALAQKGYGRPIEKITDGSTVIFNATLKDTATSFLIAALSSTIVYSLNLLIPTNV